MVNFDVFISGVPGKSRTHGGFGWSSVSLLRDDRRTILVETGPPAYIPLLQQRLNALGLGPDDVTHILITHLHWDHVGNFTMFPNAQVIIGRNEMDWAIQQPAGTTFIPDLHIAELARRTTQTRFVTTNDEALPDIGVLDVPGHTPGHIAYRVNTSNGLILFAGDSIKNRFELATGQVDSTMDSMQSRRSVSSLKRILETEPNGILVPGHDVPLKIVDGMIVATASHNVDVEVVVDTTAAAVGRHLV